MKAFIALGLLFACAGALLFYRPPATEFEKGKAAIYAGHVSEARQHFSAMAKDDPMFAQAQLYLGRSDVSDLLMEDSSIGPRAIEEFSAVLRVNPNNLEAIKSIAVAYFSMARSPESRLFCWRALQLAHDDTQMLYLLGVIDWEEAYQPRMKYRAAHNIPVKESLFDKPGCAGMRRQNLVNVEDGIHVLKRALAFRPDFRDAMAYLSMLYRERADIPCGDPAAHDADMRQAEEWLARWLATKQSSIRPEDRTGYYLQLPPPPPPPPSSDSPSH